MRTFVTVAHDAPTNGAWPLDDLPGHGRIDLLARNITAALHLSHGLREDAQAITVFVGAGGPKAVRIGPGVRRLYPDERSTAARLGKALRHPCLDPWWEAVEPGIHVAPFGVAEVVDDTGAPVMVLDAAGQAIGAIAPRLASEDACFLLSDHRPLQESDLQGVTVAGRVSLGSTWLHGHQTIHIVQWTLDAVAESSLPTL